MTVIRFQPRDQRQHQNRDQDPYQNRDHNLGLILTVTHHQNRNLPQFPQLDRGQFQDPGQCQCQNRGDVLTHRFNQNPKHQSLTIAAINLLICSIE